MPDFSKKDPSLRNATIYGGVTGVATFTFAKLHKASNKVSLRLGLASGMLTGLTTFAVQKVQTNNSDVENKEKKSSLEDTFKIAMRTHL